MSLGLQLAVLVARGLMSLDDLDTATPASRELELDRMRSATDLEGHGGWPGRRSPAMRYPGAGCIQPVRNLAREWIAAHPREWQVLQQHHQPAGPQVAGHVASPEMTLQAAQPTGPQAVQQAGPQAPLQPLPQAALPEDGPHTHRPGTAPRPGARSGQASSTSTATSVHAH